MIGQWFLIAISGWRSILQVLITRASAGFISTETGPLQNREVLDEILEEDVLLCSANGVVCKTFEMPPMPLENPALHRRLGNGHHSRLHNYLPYGHAGRSYPENVGRDLICSDRDVEVL